METVAANIDKTNQESCQVPFEYKTNLDIKSVTKTENPIPEKCIPIAFVLFSILSLVITIAEPTTRLIAAAKPAITLELNHKSSFEVSASTSVVKTHKTIPNLKYLTFALISFINIAKIEPPK